MKTHSLTSITIAAILVLGIVAVVPASAHQEHTDFITNAEYIKGHLEQAVANKEANNTELAVAHAGHPVHEVFTLMEGPLSEVAPERAAALKSTLENLANSIDSDSLQTVTDKVSEIDGMLDETVEVFAGEEAKELTTKAGVVSGLLETAGHEYEEAVANGEIVEMIEYQDASAFIKRAKAVYQTIQAEIDAHEAEEITELFGEIDSSLQTKADPEDVETLLDGIIHELGEAVPSGDEHVEFAANLKYIRGHLDQAVANKEAGNTTLAVAHASHPVHEVYALIEGEIKEHDADLNTKLGQSLTNLANQIDTMTLAQVQAQVAEINDLLDQSEEAILEEEASDTAFNGKVAMAVLETAEHEYEEAVANGEVVEMVEYQDSAAFAAQAEAIFTSIRADLPEHEAEEIAEFFEQLHSLAGSNASPEQVETVVDGIIHEFEEALELESAEGEELDGWGYIDKINDLLDQSVAEYKEGNAQQAKALAIEAYLDNYEYIESDIAEEDRGLMEKIETNMRVELVQMIEAGEPAADVESHVAMIKTDLETARAVVTPEFPLAAAIMAASVAAIVAGTLYARRKGFSTLPF